MKCLKSGIFLTLLLSTVSTAPTPFVDENPTRLPKTSVPLLYDLTLTTSVHLGQRAFTGVVKINVEITETTNILTLHNRDLIIDSVKLTNTRTSAVYAATYSEEKEKEFVIIESTESTLNLGERFTIEISYNGLLQLGTNGFYRSSYRVGTVTR